MTEHARDGIDLIQEIPHVLAQRAGLQVFVVTAGDDAKLHPPCTGPVLRHREFLENPIGLVVVSQLRRIGLTTLLTQQIGLASFDPNNKLRPNATVGRAIQSSIGPLNFMRNSPISLVHILVVARRFCGEFLWVVFIRPSANQL